MSRKLGNSFERNLKVRAKGSLTSLSMKLQEHVVAKDLLRGVTFGWLGREVAKLEREGGLGIDHQVGC
jgi:hypothetical protein